MKNIIKKMFSLLLVGVVAVSMFGFIAPNRVDAAEADINSRPRRTVTIESRAKFFCRISVTVSKDGNNEHSMSFVPRQLGDRSSSTNSFCTTGSENTIILHFSVCIPSGRRSSTAKIYKREKSRQNSNSKKKVETISIEIKEDASAHVDGLDGWTVVSQEYMEM